MSVEKISVMDVLVEMIAITKREKELFLLLGAFIASISLLFSWAYYEVYARYIQTYFETGESALSLYNEMSLELSQAGISTLSSLFLLIIHLIIMAIWSRASILGTRQALAGGIQIFFGRILWVIWRFICGMGWIFLVSFLLIIVLMFLPVTPDSEFSLLMLIILFILLLPMFAVIFLTSISIHGEARDVRLPIHKSFKYMKGNFLRAASFLIMMLIGSYILMFYGQVFVLNYYFSVPVLISLAGIFAVNMLSALFTLLSYTYGAIYASKLVPELRV